MKLDSARNFGLGLKPFNLELRPREFCSHGLRAHLKPPNNLARP